MMAMPEDEDDDMMAATSDEDDDDMMAMPEDEDDDMMAATSDEDDGGSQTYEVSMPAGTSVLGCEKTDECFIPSEITVNLGDTVTWLNDDTAAHTVTSGTIDGGPDGRFDSSLMMPDQPYSFTFEAAGDYDYYCIVHPWMIGKVIVP